ncbi:aminoglycoside phosphotransferase [Halobacteriales archaeon QS_1_67_19]|nr:MAG: aminoglycoside phosphotransferase [Halobacteriales archaeon QS_1_67_19]
MDEHIATALEAAFPDREAVDVSGTGPSWNPKNRSVEVAFADGGTVYLKIAVDGDGSRIARERAVIEHVGARTAVPVPTVVASEVEHSVPHLATAPVDGPTLIESAPGLTVDPATARRVGAALARIHACRFGEHGHIVGGGADGLEVDGQPWPDVLVDTIEETREIAPAERFDHHFDDVIDAVERNRERLARAPAALLHGDPAQPNCFRGDRGVGFLDWEIAHVGDPARELVRARRQLTRRVRAETDERAATALFEGYRSRSGSLPAGFEERAPIYEAVTFLGTSGFAEKCAEFVDESTAAFVEWVAAEMDRRLGAI